MSCDSELIQLLAWSALLYLVFCVFNTSAFLVVSVNATAFIGASLWIASGNQGSSAPTQHPHNAKSNKIEGERNATESADRRGNTNTPPNPPNLEIHAYDHHDLSLSSKPESEPGYTTIMKMYEDIIAADTETMQVQQGTIEAQQDIIRSQADMIGRLQQLVEVQEACIEEHSERCSG